MTCSGLGQLVLELQVVTPTTVLQLTSRTLLSAKIGKANSKKSWEPDAEFFPEVDALRAGEGPAFVPSQALPPARLALMLSQHPFLEGLSTGRWQTRALPPCFLAESQHGSRNRSDINGSPINNPKARGGELVPAQHWPQPTQSQGMGCLHCALGISNASCSLPAMGFPGSCPLGQCHGRSSNASAEPQLRACSGSQPDGIPGGYPVLIQLLPSSQHWTMPITGNPAATQAADPWAKQQV